MLLAGGRGRLQPRQVLRGHVAIADPRLGRLLREEVASAPSLELQSCSEATTDVAVGEWRLQLKGNRYEVQIESDAIKLELAFEAQGPPMLQGDRGFSAKGPRPAEASYYYSRPQLRVTGTLDGEAVTGEAWLDHEWSTSYLAPEASGWDWAGVNLSDGGALMLYRLRARAGGDYYAGGTLLSRDGTRRVFEPEEVEFEVARTWRSPSTGAEYPVSLRLRAASQEWLLEPLMDEQEFDGRATTQTVYWEGAVRALQGGVEVGRGHLELTGYFRALGF